jgi:hypothetical protein
MKKAFYIISTIVVFLLNVAVVFAQPGGGGDPLPCDPDDPNCPLDTWVIVLVVMAVIFAVAHLYRQKKSLQA